MSEKGFVLTNWAVKNRITIYFFLILLIVFGVVQYISTPKESMPEIDFPMFMISTTYPGTSAAEMENLITRPIETEIKGISGIDELSSQSLQDYSIIFIEFEVGVDDTQAYLDVQQALDNARANLPDDLPNEPEMNEAEISEMPILNINLSGELGLPRLKEYADDLQDIIEGLEQVNRVDIVGALEREIQVNVDLFKMQAAGVTFSDIEEVIASENMTISAGSLEADNTKKNVRVKGEFTRYDQIGDLLIREGLYIKDIAEVVDGYADRESYARLNGQDVVTLNVIKRYGENLIVTVDEIKEILEDFKKTCSPQLKINTTGDMSIRTRNSVSSTFNTMIIGFIVVTIVLMFFMGINNALFAGTAIPLSMLVAFIFIPLIGFTINNVVLIGLIVVLGILVDNSIVIVENIYRHFNTRDDMTIFQAVKDGVAEAAIPVLGGTLTTMAPFIPMMFWPGMIGEFFNYIPVVILITLAASLLVAYVMNPVFAVSFMKRAARDKTIQRNKKKQYLKFGVAAAAAVIFYVLDIMLIANLIVLGIVLVLLKRFVLDGLISKLQNKFIPWFVHLYKKVLNYFLSKKGKRALIMICVLLFLVTIILPMIRMPSITMFSQGVPDEIDIYITMPEGTHLDKTNKIALEVEDRVWKILGQNNPDVESVITNVASNAGKGLFDRSTQEKRAKVAITFVEYKDRTGELSSLDYLADLRKKLVNIPGASIVIEKSEIGPPMEKPINIEIQGDDIQQLLELTNRLMGYINELNIPGIEKLESDTEQTRHEYAIKVNRDKATKLGLDTTTIGSTLRTALFGSEVADYREGEDEYTIRVRLDKKYRGDIEMLLNQRVKTAGTSGQTAFVPLSSVVSLEEIATYGGIIRLDSTRTVTVSSEVMAGFNPNDVVMRIQQGLREFEVPDGCSVKFTGQMSQQEEEGSFIIVALFGAVALILLLLVIQFNSISKPLIILTQILFSYIGIILGIILFGVDFSIIMSGMAIVAVGGVVATNGIILIDYSDRMTASMEDKREAVIKAASIRLTPVLLTALSTVFGVLPLATGINIDLIGLFSHLKPDVFIGGPDAAFWQPLALALIFGLTIATFLTLIVEPVMYYYIVARKKKGVSDS